MLVKIKKKSRLLRVKTSHEVQQAYLSQGLSKNFCTVPFTTLIIEPDGKVGSCRQKGTEFSVGHIDEKSLADIWNDEPLKKWRREFLQGNPKNCSREVRDRMCHLCPVVNSNFPEVELAEHQSRRPIRLIFNLNGKCNLECQMCTVHKKPNGLHDKNNFWSQFDDMTQDLQEVELLSGEPFIQKDTYKLIDLISQKKPLAKWCFTTNANWKFNEFIKSALDKIVVRNIIVSLDSTSVDTYSKIRIKGDYQLALKTLHDLQNYEKDRLARGLSPLHIKINFLIQKDNWHELGEMAQFGRDHQVEIFRTFVYEPYEHSLLSLTAEEKERILEHYLQNIPLEDFKHSMRVVLPVLDSCSSLFKASFLNQISTTLAKNSLTFSI